MVRAWLLFCAIPCLFAQNDAATPRKALVSGKVLNGATGEPVRKAKVALFGLNQKSPAGSSAVTDAAGAFELPNLPPGSYMLIASHDGFVPPDNKSKLKEQRFTLAEGEEKRDLTVRLTPFGVITGHILDEEGDPIRHLEVQAMVYAYKSTGRQLETRGGANSDDRGVYRLYDVTPGQYFLRAGSFQMVGGNDEAYGTSYYPGTSDAAAASAIEVRAGQEVDGIDLALHKTRLAQIRGRVLNPGSNLQVGLRTASDGGSSVSTTTVDDPKGKFVLRGVSPGAYTLIAQATVGGQHCTAHMPIQVGASDQENIELHLQPPMEIGGQIRVEGKSQAKLTKLAVELEGEGRYIDSAESGETKEDGSFVIQGLEPGLYQVSASAPGDLYLKAVRWSDRDITQSGLDLTQGAGGNGLVVVLSTGGRIGGIVEDDQGTAAAGATVALVPTDASRKRTLTRGAITDREGRFHITAIAPGAYKLYAIEEVDPNRVKYDPEFLKPLESQAQSVEIAESDKESVHLKLIKPPEEQK